LLLLLLLLLLWLMLLTALLRRGCLCLPALQLQLGLHLLLLPQFLLRQAVLQPHQLLHVMRHNLQQHKQQHTSRVTPQSHFLLLFARCCAPLQPLLQLHTHASVHAKQRDIV
jgi:hypothetical protein